MRPPVDRAGPATTAAQAPAPRPWFSRLGAPLARMKAGWVEELAVVVAAGLAALHAEWRIVSGPLVFQTDAQIHEFWMRRFQDAALFQDPLTKALLATGYEPPGFQAVYWVASHLVDPVRFGEVLPLVLQPLAVWLVFRIVREHTPWRPAAWLGAALFLVPWDIHRFSGGHPRAFAQPIVLLAVFLLLRRRTAAAALVPPLGALLYPPTSLVALAVVLLSAIDRTGRFFLDRTRASWAVASAVAFAVVTVGTRVLLGSDGLISVDEARRYPEFGPSGQMHFFATSTLDYLSQNYSGFFLGPAGSILAVSAILLLLLRPRNATLLRWEVWSVPIASLTLFTTAHALLFHLYLPHRYTYPLLPFFCIAVAVMLRPTLEALGRRRFGLLGLSPLLALALAGVGLIAFPLGPRRSIAGFGAWLGDAVWYLAIGLGVGLMLAAVAIWRHSPRRTAPAAAAAALLTGSLLVGEVTFAGGGHSPAATSCSHGAVYRYLGTLPAEAVIAGDPSVLSCVPIAARRPVLISRKLYQPWERDYFRIIRPRMFATMEAMYGGNRGAIVALRTRYGADYLLVRTAARRRPPPRMAPFTEQVSRLLRGVAVPAVGRLPSSCETWRAGRFVVYDLACVAEAGPR